MTENEKKKLLELLEAMSETSVDIFWGGNPAITEKEKEDLTQGDYKTAYTDACLNYISELEETESSWLIELYSIIADKYGVNLKRRILGKQMGFYKD